MMIYERMNVIYTTVSIRVQGGNFLVLRTLPARWVYLFVNRKISTITFSRVFQNDAATTWKNRKLRLKGLEL